MNNKQKRKYMSTLMTLSVPFFMNDVDISRRREFQKQIPLSLFKYRSFDEYTFDMIDNSYVFLASVKGLDDPFECRNNPGIGSIWNPKKGSITSKGLDYLVRLVSSFGLPEGMTPSKLKKLARDSMNGAQIEYEVAIKHPLIGQHLPEERVSDFLAFMETYNENLGNLLKECGWERLFEKMLLPEDKIGVCSLSETGDNKPMWSLYSSNYSGYCVEYEIPKEASIVRNLCPVIYSKRPNNDLSKKLIEHSLSAMMYSISSGRLDGNIGAIMELLCTKDSAWSYQREWRIIGGAGEKVAGLRIKAVYLGFAVSERNQLKMLEAAKSNGFRLLKMNPPDSTKRITYREMWSKDN